MSPVRKNSVQAPQTGQTRVVNPASKLPLYQQIYEILHGKIMNGEWKADFMIPPESELIEQFQVSRITVRTVLDMLADEGLIRRERGRGTFVSGLKLEHGLTHIISFTEDMRTRGFEARTKMLSAGLIPAPTYIAGKLAVPEGEELVHLVRLRIAGDTPMCVENSYLVHRYCPGILKYDFSKSSLREVKARDYNLRWASAKQTIQAVLSTPELSDALEVTRRSPLLFIERVSFSQNNVPVEFLRAHYRADHYTMYCELKGSA
jgi:GntR family transcriptional regulator